MRDSIQETEGTATGSMEANGRIRKALVKSGTTFRSQILACSTGSSCKREATRNDMLQQRALFDSCGVFWELLEARSVVGMPCVASSWYEYLDHETETRERTD